MNHLPADDSHEISSLIWFLKAALSKRYGNCQVLQIKGGTLEVKDNVYFLKNLVLL